MERASLEGPGFSARFAGASLRGLINLRQVVVRRGDGFPAVTNLSLLLEEWKKPWQSTVRASSMSKASCFALPHAMTKIELARVIAARTTARFVEIAPRRGIRVGDAMRKLREEDAKRLSEILEAELERLIRNW